MTYEIHGCRTRFDREPLILRTDTPDRAAELARALDASGHYVGVLVIIGHKRFSYSDFIQQLKEKTI